MEVKMGVNSLRSRKIKRTIVMTVESSPAKHTSTLTPILTPSLTSLTPKICPLGFDSLGGSKDKEIKFNN